MWTQENEAGLYLVVVTRRLPGALWKTILVNAGFRIDEWTGPGSPGDEDLAEALRDGCDAVIGQLTEVWDENRLSALHAAGGRVYSNYAVGYNNVDVDAASRLGIAVTNTPGVLTEATAELAVALTLAAARRITEGDRMVREGRFTGWAPDLLLGTELRGKTLGLVGPGRIGSAYARIMVAAFGMDLVYHGPSGKPELETRIAEMHRGSSTPALCRHEPDLDALLRVAHVVSLHPPLTAETRHLVNAARLSLMKPDAILVNVSRGPVMDEAALVSHCREHSEFRAALDVFEDEPQLKPGLAEQPNVVLAPHVGSASTWTREAMSVLAARNTVGVIEGYPLWSDDDFEPLLVENAPRAIPSVINPEVLKVG